MVTNGCVSIRFNFKTGPHRSFVLTLHIFFFPRWAGLGGWLVIISGFQKGAQTVQTLPDIIQARSVNRSSRRPQFYRLSVLSDHTGPPGFTSISI